MAYNLIVSKEAHQDIDAIVHYIANELANLTAAVALLNDVEKFNLKNSLPDLRKRLL